MLRLTLLLFVALSGCTPQSIGTGRIETGQALVPPMPRHVTNFQKWEHICFAGFNSLEELSARMAEAGQQGWEMVTGWQGAMCFKRPAPQGAATTARHD